MLRKIFGLLARLFLIGTFCIGAAIWYYSRDLPSHADLVSYYPPLTTRVYSNDGILMQEYSKENRLFVPINSVPRSTIEAFLAAEDANFYNHPGIDIAGIVRAAINNIRRGGPAQGGSTITQQVVKYFLLSSDKSFERKIKEAILAWKISRILSKDQILELYLNQIFLGYNSYGIGAAAQNYFNKSVAELSIEESALLAGLPKAPSRFNPRKAYKAALERRNYVLRRMAKQNFISKEAAQKYSKTPINLVKREKSEQIIAPYYADQVRSKVIEMFGEEYFYNGGLTIISCMDSQMQKHAIKSLRYGLRRYDSQTYYRGVFANIDIDDWQQKLEHIKFVPGQQDYKLAVVLALPEERPAKIGLADGDIAEINLSEVKWTASELPDDPGYLFKIGDVIFVSKNGKGEFALKQIPKAGGGIIAIAPSTGRVLAMSGGYDFQLSRFNRATKAKRQPGSSVKPLVYLAALESGIKPNEIFLDDIVNLGQGKGLDIWTPKNSDNKFLGPITMRRGLEKSRNLITISIAQKIGINKVTEVMKRFGVSDDPPAINSIVLGSVETTLEKVTNAYAIIANNGEQTMPHYVEVIKDRNGKVIYKRDQRQCILCSNLDPLQFDEVDLPVLSAKESRMITDKASNYQIASMLEGAVQRGTGWRARELKKIVAAKTGTTNDSFDAWFVGFTPKIAVALLSDLITRLPLARDVWIKRGRADFCAFYAKGLQNTLSADKDSRRY